MLNEFQRRRVSITLRSLEEDLDQLQTSIKSYGYAGILYEIKNDISLGAKDMLIANISMIKEKIRLLAGRFALEKKTDNLSRCLNGELSLLVVSVEEIMSQRLRGSGEVAEGLKEALDSELVSVRNILGNMLEILARDTAGNEKGKEGF